MENGRQPATKHDIEQLRSELKQDIELLRSEVSHIHRDLGERLERSETNLLKAFYSFAESNNRRIGQIEGNMSAFTDRLSTLEIRVLEIEKRLNIPPTA
jgi:uncharacterized protein YceH (UPF0502 family)